MKGRKYIVLVAVMMLLGVFSITDAMAQSDNVWLLEADENNDGVTVEKGFSTISGALDWMAGENGYVVPTEEGTVHLELRGDVVEPSSNPNNANVKHFNLSKFAQLKVVEIYSQNQSNGSTGNKISTPKVTYSSTTKTRVSINDLVEFKGQGKVYMHHLLFDEGSYLPLAFNREKSSGITVTEISNCTAYSCELEINQYAGNKANSIIESSADLKRVSDKYVVNGNIFTENDSYAFCVTGFHGDFDLEFNNNYITRFRALTVKPETSEAKVNITAKGNKLYHQIDYSTHEGISSCVALCQVTGYLNGSYDFENNIMLGIFTKGDKVKAPGLLVQHTYQGILDGSVITIKDNTLQCDNSEFAYKQGAGSSYETRGYTKELVDGTYDPKHTYTVNVSGLKLIHLYPSAAYQHSDDDLCHICSACGQMFVRGELIGAGSSLYYKDSERNWKEAINIASSVSNNIDLTKVAPGVELIDIVEPLNNLVGICVDAKDSIEFKLHLDGTALTSITLNGPANSPRDMTAQAVTSDGGHNYYFSYTNDFTQAEPYISCPLITVKTSIISITVTKEGLKAGESAVFSIYDRNNPAKKVNLILTGVDNDGTAVSQKVSVFLGTKDVTVMEQPWSWAYTMDGDTELTQDISDTEHGKNVFTFTNTPKESTPLHSEAIKGNSVVGYEDGGIVVDVKDWEKAESRKIRF